MAGRSSSLVVAAFAAGFVAVSPALAAGCVADTKSPEAVAKILSELPVLAGPDARGGGVANSVRDAIISDASSLPTIMALLKPASGDASRANPRVSRMIATGLAVAAGMCASSQPEVAQNIQQAILASADPEAMQAFQVATQDIRTAAVEAGVANSPVVMAPSGLGGNPGTSRGFRAVNEGRASGADSPINIYTAPGAASGSSVSITRSAATTATTSVSPSR